MNRIAGFLHFGGRPVDPAIMDRMTGGLRLHARDASRTWVQGHVGLGCSAGEPREHLLIHSPHERYTVVFDGRLDNRRELRSSLRPAWLDGRKQVRDEELILAAYEKWGLDLAKHLIGDFAFAIWDQQRQRLVCGRDHFGVKPFYYSLSKTFFAFASTPQALLASGKIPSVIHEERIADFLVNPLEGVDKTSSFYKDVYRLSPAHMLVVQGENITLQRYWELCPSSRSESKTEPEYIEAFQELFEEAVRCRLQDVSVSASMLSGGMDSSSIVGIGCRVLAEERKDPLHVFAVLSNSPSRNRETPSISSMLAQGNVQEHLISEIELSQWIDPLVGALAEETEPFDCLMNLNRAVYLHAGEQGASALLDGIDGDTLLSGSGHLTQLWRRGAFITIFAETLKADGLTAEFKTGKSDLINGFLSAFTPLAPDWYRDLRRPVRDAKALRSSVEESIIALEFASQCQLGERFAMLDSHRPRRKTFTQMEAHRLALNHPFLTVGLERYERVASSFGIEARHPFTDVRLAEFCLGLPWQLKTRRGWTKYILRLAMEPYLPAEVIWRRDKDSLMWEVNRLIVKARAEHFYQITCDEQATLKPYVDVKKLMSFWQEYLTRGDEKHAELIWSGIALALWLRRQRELQAA